MRRNRFVPIALTASSAGLLVISFPPCNVGAFTAWLALVPLFFAVRESGPGMATALGAAWGLLANLGIFSWLLAVPYLRWYQFALLDLTFCLFPAAWCLILSRLDLQRPSRELYAAGLWVSLEYARSHVGFLALPWATLAQTQLDNTWLVQIAAYLGESAVSFLVVLGNLALYRLLRIGAVSLSCVLPLAAATVLGAFTIAGESAEAPTELAALNTQYAAYGPRLISPEARMQSTLDFLERQLPPQAALLALPETSFIHLSAFSNVNVFDRLRKLAAAHQSTFLVGVGEATKFEQTVAPRSPLEARVSNTAWIVKPGELEPQRYLKVRRVPFAEYLPLEGWVRWPRALVGQPLQIVPGPGPVSFAISPTLSVGILICWESLFADQARELVRRGATVLAVLTNEAWFGSSESAQHNLTARMRAVETRRPIIVASNAGQSLIVDRFGRVIRAAAVGPTPRWVRAAVATDRTMTPYVRYGDVFALACDAVSALVAAIWIVRRRRVGEKRGAFDELESRVSPRATTS
jgi:apolipoprotein N-acyltransferase